MAAKATKGLLLTLGGAPNTPHVIEGLPGYYSPTVPHIVGEGADVPLELAKTAAKEHSDVLDLVSVKAGDVDDALAAHKDFVAEGRGALLEARRDGRAEDDPSRTEDEIDALKEA